MSADAAPQIPRGKLPKIGKQKRPLYNREEARALMTDPCSSSFDCSGPPSSEACVGAETGREFSVRMQSVKDQHIREYTERDWAKVAGSDRDHWVQRFRAEGPRATVEASHALFEHARSARADFPGSRYVAADLGAQVRLKQLLDRAAHAFAIR